MDYYESILSACDASMLLDGHVSMLAMKESYRQLGQNLGYLVEAKLTTRRLLADAMSISVQAVGQLIRGETKELKPSNLVRAAKLIGLSSDDLVTRNLRRELWRPVTHLHMGPSVRESPLLYFPVLSIAGSAGPGSEADHLEVIDELAFRRDWIKKKGWEPKQLFVHHVKGDSMADWMPDGNIALVHRGDLVVRETPRTPYDNVFALQDGPSFRFKQIVPQDAEALVLRSFNQEHDGKGRRLYPDERRSWDELGSLHIIGRVVWRGG